MIIVVSHEARTSAYAMRTYVHINPLLPKVALKLLSVFGYLEDCALTESAQGAKNNVYQWP